MSDSRFCFLEEDWFPDSEFEDDPALGVVHLKEPRHTISGEPTDDGWPYENLGGA